jgi:hypothetical protein
MMRAEVTRQNESRGLDATLLATLLALFAAGVAVAQETTAPVLLRRTPLVTPPEMVASEGSPEVKVRLSVDERGKVASVTALSVTPSTALDAMIRADVAEQLASWRFAPAREAGRPVASEVELHVQYRVFPESRAALTAQLADEFLFGDPGRRISQLLGLDLARRKVLIDHNAQIAERNLDQKHRRRADTPRFVAVSDARDERTVEVLASNLEAVYNQLVEVFGGGLELQPERYKMVVYLFARRPALQTTQLQLRDSTMAEGFYVPPGFLAFHQEAIDPADVLSLMIHEAFHAFSDRLLRNPQRSPLPWLEEGLAMYFGNSQIKQGKLVPGKTVLRKFLMHYGQVFDRQTPAGSTVQELKASARRGELPSVQGLLEATPQDFYGERLADYYGASWLFIHFLRHAEAGWAEQRFPDFFLYLCEGYPPEAALQEVYGLRLESANERFLQYVKRF